MKIVTATCHHAELVGKLGYHTCSCGRRMYVKNVEVVGSNRRAVPYVGSYAIPVNELGWYLADGIHLN